jgi:thiamine pyrophosphate-dependent acetolactate synthase large subunit-like protein
MPALIGGGRYRLESCGRPGDRHRPGQPDFCALAEAYGAAGEAVTDTEAFGDALDRALKAGRPALLELRVDLEAIAPGLELSALRRR